MITTRALVSLVTVLLVISPPSTAVTPEDLSDYKALEHAVEQKVLDELNEILGDTTTTTEAPTEEIYHKVRPRFFGKKDEDEELGMDTLTIIWYLTTFTALFGFFIVMACTDNTCSRRRTLKPAETRDPTPSPCPSYKHFAPPSYGSVMKKLKEQKIYIVPVHEGNNNFFSHPTSSTNASADGEKNETITVSR